jgi:hypothetical protein
MGTPSSPPKARQLERRRLALYGCLVSAAAVGAVALRALVPAAVPDAISAIFLLLAFVPWLLPFIKSLKYGELVIDFQNLLREVKETRNVAVSARRRADLARGAALSAMVRAETAAAEIDAGGEARERAGRGPEDLYALADEYDRRETRQPGPDRKPDLAELMGRMIAAARRLPPETIGQPFSPRRIEQLLLEGGGKRMLAYAVLYAHPRQFADLLKPLIESAADVESTRFGQYWGIQAIGRIISEMERSKISPTLVNALKKLYKQLPPASGRRYEVSRILKGLEAGGTKKKRLRVTFGDGVVIEEYNATATFAQALQRLDLARVAALGLTLVGIPLVGKAKSDQYGQWKIDGFYICMHSSTQRKKELLEKIAGELGIPLKVVIVPTSGSASQ